MKNSIVSLSLAIALSAGLAGAALADQTGNGTSSSPVQVATMPSDNLARQQAMENEAVRAYNAGINPFASYHTTGIYDQGDAVTGPNGFTLPGYDGYKEDPMSFGGG